MRRTAILRPNPVDPNDAMVMRDASSRGTEFVVPNAGHSLMEEVSDVTTVAAVHGFLDGRPVVGAK